MQDESYHGSSVVSSQNATCISSHWLQLVCMPKNRGPESSHPWASTSQLVHVLVTLATPDGLTAKVRDRIRPWKSSELITGRTCSLPLPGR